MRLTYNDSFDGFPSVSPDGKKMLVLRGNSGTIQSASAGASGKPVVTAGMKVSIDPRQEWKQIFTDAWRIQRDYFYDPYMHGVDWDAMRKRYAALLRDAVTRWDVSYVIGELIGELNASHTYRSGGDVEKPEKRGVGYLEMTGYPVRP